MDIPISLLNWEVFLPEQYKVKDFGGDVIAANLVPAAFREEAAINHQPQDEGASNNFRVQAPAGQMGGYVVDPTGAAIPNARVTITYATTGSGVSTTTDASGRWTLGGVSSGSYAARTDAVGFKSSILNLNYNANQPSMYEFPLSIGNVSETVEVTAQAVQVQAETSTNAYHGSVTNNSLFGLTVGGPITNVPINGRNLTSLATPAPGAASANVMNLQRRVAGVLPVAVDVPRAGTSFSFVRPLVLDEETKVTFSYKSR